MGMSPASNMPPAPPHMLYHPLLPIRNTRSKHSTLSKIACSNQCFLPLRWLVHRERERMWREIEESEHEKGREEGGVRQRLASVEGVDYLSLLLWVSCSRAMTQSPAVGPAQLRRWAPSLVYTDGLFIKGGMSCMVSSFLFLLLFFSWSLRNWESCNAPGACTTPIIPISACFGSSILIDESWIGCSDIIEHKWSCLATYYILIKWS